MVRRSKYVLSFMSFFMSVSLLINACVDKNVALMEAVKAGDVQRVEKMISKGADSTCGDGAPLFEAINKGEARIIKLLVDSCPEMDERNMLKVLRLSMKSGSLKITRIFTDKYRAKRELALLFMLKEGWLDGLRFLLENYGELKEHVKSSPDSLIRALKKRCIDCAIILIENGAPVNAHDENKLTPLMEAIWLKNLDLVKLLVENGADVNAVERGLTPAKFAIVVKDINILKYFRENGAADNTNELFPLSIDKGGPEIIEYLLSEGADVNPVNHKGENGVTPLMLTSKRGNSEMINLLLKLGAHINTRDNNGKSALDYAMDSNNENSFLYLVRAGAER